ncbi:serine hydrolase domain-containing protein [Streptomyces sp. NPDC059928]|uniref:serine hydrolase domain-containing protein n=1 Tax=unclassified Streptomyces TaxID=2593676 RepID=UPI00365CA541
MMMRTTTRSRAAGLAAVAVAVVATGLTAAPAALAAPSVSGHRATQRALDAEVAAGAVGVTAEAVDKYGVWRGTSGVGDRTSGKLSGPEDRYRIGSITKTFVATVLLQLEAEGRLSLDDAVDHWLPGVVRGHGHDGRRITLRQVLDHTSGIYDVTSDPDFAKMAFTTDFLAHRYDTWTPAQLVDVAMRHQPDFAPGTSWKYSNTNYILAGLVIEKATGRTYGDEIRDRIINPLQLHGTSVPGTDPRMPRPSSRAYSKLSQDPDAQRVYDVTQINPSLTSSAGEMISDSADLTRFYRALLGGRLLPKSQLDEMKTTVTEGPDKTDKSYGLALMKVQLPCGTTVWGHSGGIHGSSSLAVTTEDGRHALALNFNSDWAGDTTKVLKAEFCDN